MKAFTNIFVIVRAPQIAREEKIHVVHQVLEFYFLDFCLFLYDFARRVTHCILRAQILDAAFEKSE